MNDVAKKIWLNGTLVEPQQASVSVFDHGVLYGDGVFEGIRAYRGRIFKMQTHLKRLFDSARAIRLEIPYSIDELEQAIRQTVDANGQKDAYIRMCVTRGEGTLGLNPFLCVKPSVFIIVDKIELYPPELYENGLEVITASVMRNHPAALSPRIKSMNYLNNILAKIEALDAGLMEAIMLNHQGCVSEATGDNVFVVRVYNGRQVLLTPPLHAGILEGVTRNTVDRLARESDVPVEHIDLTRHDLYTADEIFLTGTAAEVIPVTKVDGRSVGRGEPGPLTRKLISAFHQFVTNNTPED